MAKKRTQLKPLGALYIVGGIVSLISAIFLDLVQFQLGTLLAIPALLIFLIVGAIELSAGRTIWRSELGSWRSLMSTSIMVLLLRAVYIYLGLPNAFINGAFVFNLGDFGNVLFYTNVALVAVELGVFLYLYRHSEFFMLDECDEKARPDLATCTIKSASECPNCHEVVEAYWQSCPYCGTSLPRICADCGNELGDMLMKCPHCGKEVMHSLSLKESINTFQKLADEDAVPETKAVRYARLAEALMKNGQADEAVAAYHRATELTSFTQKKTNFMVRAARILKNTGRESEANALLEKALALDPSDYAGASMVKSEKGNGPAPV